MTRNKANKGHCSASDGSSDKNNDDKEQSSDFSSLSLDNKLEKIFNEIKNLKVEQKSVIKVVEDIQCSFDEFGKKLKSHDSKLDNHTKLLDNLRAENVSLKSDISKLKVEFNDCLQYQRRNTVEITGLPVKKEEDVSVVLNKLFAFLRYDFSPEMIDIMHPLPTKSNSGTIILIKFVRRSDALALLGLGKKNKGLKASDLGLSANSVIYINPSLTIANRQLFKDARLMKKTHNVKYVWLQNNKILLRRTDDEKVQVINNRADLDKLKTKYDLGVSRNLESNNE